MRWEKTKYSDLRCQMLISRHYCRAVPTKAYNRLGFSLVLYAADQTGEAVFIWWRPKWESGISKAQRFDGLKAIECVIFRNESKNRSSDLIRSATEELFVWEHAKDVEWPDGLITSVNSQKTAARRGKRNPPGYCFVAAGWEWMPGKKTKNTDTWLKWSGQTVEDADVKKWLADRKNLNFSARGLNPERILAFKHMRSKRFGALTVVAYSGLRTQPNREGAIPVWTCRCDCGHDVDTRQDFLTCGSAKTCGHCTKPIPEFSAQLLRELAFAMEFEGSLGVYPITPQLSLTVRDYSGDLPREFMRSTGLGKIYTIAKKQIRWVVTGYEAVELARQLVPYMITKREQAVAVASYPIGARSQRVASDVKEERERLITLTAALNRRGPRSPAVEWDGYGREWIAAIQDMPDEQRLSLLALAMEFEGTVGVYQHRSKASKGGFRHSAQFSVPQAVHRRVLLDVVQFLARGVGSIGAPRTDKRPENSPISTWIVHRYVEAAELSAQVLPFLSYKRSRAELVTKFPTASWDERCHLAAESKRLCPKQLTVKPMDHTTEEANAENER